MKYGSLFAGIGGIDLGLVQPEEEATAAGTDGEDVQDEPVHE